MRGARAGLARRAALRAFGLPAVTNRLPCPTCGFVEAELDVGDRARARAAPPRARPGPELQQVRERAGRRGRGAAVAEAVVEDPPRRLRERGVGLGELAELLLGVRIAGDVRVVLPGLGPERALDRRRVGSAVDAQNPVVVARRCSLHSSLLPRAGLRRNRFGSSRVLSTSAPAASCRRPGLRSRRALGRCLDPGSRISAAADHLPAGVGLHLRAEPAGAPSPAAAQAAAATTGATARATSTAATTAVAAGAASTSGPPSARRLLPPATTAAATRSRATRGA